MASAPCCAATILSCGSPRLALASLSVHHQMLHWFAVVCMVAIITWVIIDLFGPVVRYKICNPLDGALDSPEFVRQLEALASSRAVANTRIEPLPNGVNFYEAELQAIAQAQKSVNWVAYIFTHGEIAQTHGGSAHRAGARRRWK